MTMLSILARLSLAASFAFAGVMKLRDRDKTMGSLVAFGVPEALAPTLGLAIPGVELVVAVALLFEVSASWAALASLTLLLLFSVAISARLWHGDRIECNCFGRFSAEPVSLRTVFRNLALMILSVAASGIPLNEYRNRFVQLADVVTSGNAPVVSLLVLSQFTLLAFVTVLLRRIDGITARLDASKSDSATLHTPVAANEPLAIGSRAPGFHALDADGTPFAVADAIVAKGAVLLLFVNPSCLACDEVLPDAVRWEREHANQFTVLVVTHGDRILNQKKAKRFGLQRIVIQSGHEAELLYKIEQTPSAILIRAGSIAAHTAIGPEQIKALVGTLIAPSALTVGDYVPEVRLNSLSGSESPIAEDGRRSLLLFWSPSCGFCRDMLPDLKAIEESERAPDAPELVLIATGSEVANRQQGLSSQILMDPNFEAGRLFGVSGTPSAVLVDAHRRVASQVVVGAAEILGIMNVLPAESFVRACIAMRRNMYVSV